jgi:hypothetical protein
MHRYVRKRGEIVDGALRKRWFNLIRVDDSALAYQFRQQSCVVTGACANMDDPFAFLWS